MTAAAGDQVRVAVAVDVAGRGDGLAPDGRTPLDVPVTLEVNTSHGSSGIHGVILHRASGPIELVREMPNVARLTQPGQPQHDVSLPRRSLPDCLAEDLRRLDPDDLFGEVVRNGIAKLGLAGTTGSSSTRRE